MVGPSERDPQSTSGLADPTRDIRLPPLPGRAGPELPPEWQAIRAERSTQAEPAQPEPPDTLADQPTDQLGQPPQGDRDRTLTFSGTSAQRWAAGHPATPDPAWSSVPAAPGPVVAPRQRPERRSRRWPWVVLTLVPILVIVVTGVWLLLLMRG